MSQFVCGLHVMPSKKYLEWHETHLASLSLRQSVPVAPTPLLHVHFFKFEVAVLVTVTLVLAGNDGMVGEYVAVSVPRMMLMSI